MKRFLATLLLLTAMTLPAIAEDVHYTITVGQMGNTTMHDGNSFPIWGFRSGGGMMSPYAVPGPLIRANEGDTVFLHFTNTSPLPHTIHPHGLDVSQEADGVPQTSFEVQGMMGTYTYEFVAPHAGTYAYHCHVHTVRHLQMGMYGAVVIDPPNGSQNVWQDGPAYDLECIWVTGEYDSYWHLYGGDEEDDFPYHDFNPDYFIVNGKSATDIENDPASIATVSVGQTLLARTVNMGFLPHRFVFGNLPVTVVSSDGRPLPETMQNTVTEWTVYPGERYDFLIQPTTGGDYQITVDYLSIYDDSLIGTAQIPIIVEGTLGIDEDIHTLKNHLDQNYPNPFNPATTIRYILDRPAPVQLSVYDTAGRLVKTLIQAEQSSGEHSITWNGIDTNDTAVASGSYFYTLQIGLHIVDKRKMIYLK